MKIGIFVLILIIVIVASVIFIRYAGNGNNAQECISDSDCVPFECCHATSCILQSEKAPCNLLCTQECVNNTMDCGQGSCICQNNKCLAQIK